MAAQLQGSAFLEKGQALLVIVLVMVVTLTVGLSLATRSITNSRISTEEDNSQKAFSAAEAGIEELLKTDGDLSEKSDSGLDTTYKAVVMPRSSGRILLNGGGIVAKDEGADLWLSTPNFTGPSPSYSAQKSGTFTVHWEQGESCLSTSTKPTAAIEVIVLEGNSQTAPTAKHYVFDPCGPRQSGNNFSPSQASGETIDNVTFQFRGSFPVTLGFVARVIPLYGSTHVGVTASDIPDQGRRIESTGKSGGTARKITVFRSYPKLPIELFAYSIFSP